jgi:hypothetical protein
MPYHSALTHVNAWPIVSDPEINSVSVYHSIATFHKKSYFYRFIIGIDPP